MNLTEVEPPTSFNMDLRSYQKKGLDWLMRREMHETPVDGTQEDVDKTEPMNPLWQEFKWPQQPVTRRRRRGTLMTMISTHKTAFMLIYTMVISHFIPQAEKVGSGWYSCGRDGSRQDYFDNGAHPLKSLQCGTATAACGTTFCQIHNPCSRAHVVVVAVGERGICCIQAGPHANSRLLRKCHYL